MAMVVKNNMSAISTLNTLNKNSSALAKSLEKVSSGMKINGAADDASGYAISERMRVQIRSLDQANQNTQNGNSMMKTAEGAVSSTVEILKTLKEKVINAANDTNTDSDRQTIQKELNQSIDQIDDNANITFNGKYLVDGSKNTIGKATFTSMSNQALSTDTKASTGLTDLKARNGDDLSLSSTDKVTVSYVQNGKTYSTTFQVGDLDGDGTNKQATLQDIFNKAEDIDTTTDIFANSGNRSIGKAMNMSEQDIQTTAASIAEKKSDYLGAKADLDTAKTNEQNAQTTFDTNVATAKTDAEALAAMVSTYNATATTALNVGATTDDGVAYKTAFDTAYAALDGVAKATFDGVSGATAAVATLASSASDVTAASTALATAKTNTTAKQTAYDTAKSDYVDAGGVPKLLEGSNIGIAASDDLVKTASGQNAITVTAANDGIHGQISGLNISVTDSEGNVKKSANAALDAFDETIRAQNKSEDNAITLQVGAKANQSIKVGLTDMRSEALGLKGSDGTKLNISTQVKANAAVNVLDNAIQKALDQQTTIGSIESRLSYTSANLTTASENVQASESAIRDADMAKEMTQYTKNNVLLQAAQSMLAQANQNSSAVLSLLQ